MTAEDLILELQKRDPKTVILIQGYQNGFQTVPGLKTLTIGADPNHTENRGEYKLRIVDGNPTK